jgi:predicted glycosyltransferase
MSLRVFIAVTHLLGVGHLARAAAIGRALARTGHSVLLASGGRPAPLVSTQGLMLLQLPPVHCVGTDFRTLLGDDGVPIGEAELARRRALLVGGFRAFAPQVLVTELFPFGRRRRWTGSGAGSTVFWCMATRGSLPCRSRGRSTRRSKGG